MRQRLYGYLADRPAGASPEELLDLVFTARGRDPEFGPRFLATLLGTDPRFRFDADAGRWRARAFDALARPCAEASFVVVDLETTGGPAGGTGITEIGAVRVRQGRLAETFATLVNPERPIPPFVSRLTGITDEMVAEAPRIDAVLPRFLEFAGDDVLVAHNAAFDLAHLNAAAERVVGRRLDHPGLCTLRLARRLLPELRRRALDVVASHLGIACFGRHRALPDARIAAEILCVFLERAAGRGITRVDQLLDFQRSAADGRPFVVHVPRQRLDGVPATPGVYHLLGEDGRLLYVGKAVRLRERLASYFTNARGHSPRVLDLIRHVYDFRVTETGSELAASLLEARQIRDLKPPYNRQRKHLPRVGFLKLGVRGTYPRLWVTERLAPDRALYVGPFRSRDAADRAHAVLGRLFGLRTCPGALAPSPAATPCLSGQVGACTAPCAARVDAAAYRAQVDALVAFLAGENEAPLAALVARRDRLAAGERFEAAARVQRDLELLETLRARQRALAWVLARQNFVVLLPTVARDAALFYAVLGGRLAFELRIAAIGDLAAAVDLVRQRFAAYQDVPLGRDDVDATTIIAAWLRDRRANDGVLLPLDGPDAIVDRLDELAVTVRDLGLPGPLPAIDALT
ncbi:MAG TPA: exonuclease domain-containing protein [Candidatus Binatia bacterium]|nr:exonuclease domain-containing protein [Candidatus Binatia bacterium]